MDLFSSSIFGAFIVIAMAFFVIFLCESEEKKRKAQKDEEKGVSGEK